MKDFCKRCEYRDVVPEGYASQADGDYGCPLPRQQLARRSARLALSALNDTGKFLAFSLAIAGHSEVWRMPKVYEATQDNIRELQQARQAVNDCIVTREIDAALAPGPLPKG